MAEIDNTSIWSYNGTNHSIYGGGLLGNATSKDQSPYHTVQQILDRYVTTATCILGCLGNIVNLFVLVKMRRRQVDGGRENGANIGLISLAISDLLFCIVLFPRGFSSAHKALFPYGFSLLYQAYGTWLVTTFILTSTWITVTMATLRYVAICHPLYSRRFDGVTFAKISYTITFIMGVLFNLPSFWQYHLSHFTDDLYLLDIGLLDLSTPLGQAYQCIRAILGIFIPAVILMFCNASLISALRSSYRMRRDSHVKDAGVAARNRVTAILIIIATSFILLVFPSEMMDFFHGMSLESSNTDVTMLVRSVTNLLQILNFTFNFVLYCALNVHFRNVLKECLCALSVYLKHNSNSNDAASDFERQWLQLTKTENTVKIVPPRN